MCDKALEESDTVAKAWFRRGEAQLALNDCESAKLDFDKCAELEPDNKVENNCCQEVDLSLTLRYTGLFWSFRHNLHSSNTIELLKLFCGLGHSWYPCDQIHMKIGPNQAFVLELWGWGAIMAQPHVTQC